MFINVDFPAPEGPMIPISSLLQNFPERDFSRALNPEKSHTFLKKEVNIKTTWDWKQLVPENQDICDVII